MAKILVTGMSGTGKSTALEVLAGRGHRTVDTDTDQWSRWAALPNGAPRPNCRPHEQPVRQTARGTRGDPGGPRHGRAPARATATVEIDARATIDAVVQQLEDLARS